MLGVTSDAHVHRASLLFILSLRGLSKQATARRGNLFGTMGMAASPS
jgi:NAD/NADP transhydrogenase beta subunit